VETKNKKWKENPKNTPAGGQGCCPSLWDSLDRKQYHNREHAEWDFAPYMDILPSVCSQGK